MDLLLWRHAEAVDSTPDHARELTSRGLEQARSVAAWLEQRQPRKLLVLSSPTVRTRQTAAAFTNNYNVINSLGPDAGVSDILAAAGWPDGDTPCLIVGHQPALGRLAGLLLSGVEHNVTIKKGALWWFSNRVRAGETQTVLRAAIPPDFA